MKPRDTKNEWLHFCVALVLILSAITVAGVVLHVTGGE